MTSATFTKIIDSVINVDNNYGEYFVKHLSKNIFNIDLSKLSSIDTSIDESKIKNKNYSQLKNKMKKLMVSIDIKNYIDNMNKDLINVDVPSSNNNILLLQIFHFVNKMYIQDDEVLSLLLMNFGNNLYNKTPSYGTSNNLRSRHFNNDSNFKKYIFEDVYNAFWQTNYDEKLVFYNYVKTFDNDISYINLINNINKYITTNGISKINKLARNISMYLRQNNKLNMCNTLNFLSNNFNPDKSIYNFIIEYYNIKYSNEYNYILKIINCCNQIKPSGEDNRFLYLIYLELSIQNIQNILDETLFKQFTKLFYDNIEKFWLKSIERPIFFNEHSNTLYDFQVWNMSNDNYNNVIEIIDKTYNEINKLKKKIKKTGVKCSKTISKALKTKVWHKYIGKELGIHKCLCCNNIDINQLDFECGHILAKTNGGKNIIENLRPICGICNKSMGTTHMFEFMEQNGFKPLPK